MLRCIFMLKSHVIEVDGVFVGAVVLMSQGYKLVAIAPELTALDGTTVASPEAGRRLAARALRLGPAGARQRPSITRNISAD